MTTTGRYLRVVGTGGTLWEGSTSPYRLIRLAQKVGMKQSSHPADPVGTVT